MDDRSLFDSTVLRQVLRRWDTPAALGRHALARLVAVEQRRIRDGHADTALGRGLALKALLTDALQALRPAAGEPQYRQRVWRPFLVVTQRYCLGRVPEWIMMQLGIAPRTFYRELDAGLNRISDYIRHAEAEAQRVELLSDPQPAAGVQLLAVPTLPRHPLIERTALSRQLSAWLCEQSGRAAAIHGLPGVGKTTLALRLAHDPALRRHFSGGICWIGVGAAPNQRALLGRLAEQLGLPEDQVAAHESAQALAAWLRDLLRDRPILLLLDDVWDLQDVTLLAVGGERAGHLLTTRHPEIALAFAGAYVAAVPELDSAASNILLSRLAPDAYAVAPDQLDALCPRLGGLPLALLIIGRHLQQSAYGGQRGRLAAALAQIERREVRLQLGLAERRELSMAAVIGLSVDLLDAPTQQALAALALLPPKPNSFSYTTALAVTQSAPDVLHALVNQGLVEPVGDDRYALHQLIHDYALLHLPPSDAHAPLLEHLAELCAQASFDYRSIEREQVTLDVALAAAPPSALIAVARILFVYAQFLLDRGQGVSAAAHVAHALATAQAAPDEIALAWLSVPAGCIADWQHDSAAALQHLERARNLAARHGLIDVTLSSTTLAVQIYLWRGEIDAARELAALGRAQIDTHPDPRRRAWAHVMLSSLDYYLGDYATATAQVQAAHQIYVKLGETSILGAIYQKLGVLAVAQGDYVSGLTYYDLALEHYRAAGNAVQQAKIMNNIGVAALNTGQWRKAEQFHRAALQLRRELGDHREENQSLLNLAVVSCMQHNLAQAEEWIAAGLASAQQHGPRFREAQFLINRAWLHRRARRYDAALADAEQALALARNIDHRQSIGDAWEQVALAQLRRADYAAVAAALREAEALRSAQGQSHLLAALHVYRAELELLQGNSAAAFAQIAPHLEALTGGIDGLEDFAEALQICARVLRAVGRDNQAADLQRRCAVYLRQQRAQIADPVVYQAYVAQYRQDTL